ncbi:hypothetical protein ACG0Z6_14945 [Roseateles sp. BYS180W]|uniref:Uncharacterized protein n=1 Tax=Roseateles rivi TaxID=3299028 RepID=A0ABW7FZ03_9BURK
MKFSIKYILVVAVLLVGCDRHDGPTSSQWASMRMEILQLKIDQEKLSDEYMKIREEHGRQEIIRQQRERDMLFAVVCDDWIPVCSDDFVKNGRIWLSQGYVPADPSLTKHIIVKRGFLIFVFAVLLNFVVSAIGDRRRSIAAVRQELKSSRIELLKNWEEVIALMRQKENSIRECQDKVDNLRGEIARLSGECKEWREQADYDLDMCFEVANALFEIRQQLEKSHAAVNAINSL